MALTYDPIKRRIDTAPVPNYGGTPASTVQPTQPGGTTVQKPAQAAGTQGAPAQQVGAYNPQQPVQAPAAQTGTAAGQINPNMSTGQLLAQQPGPYQYNNRAQLEQLLANVMNPTPFSFNLSANPLYQQYKDQYINLGQIAMQDAMGQAAGLTGGYGSSYGQRVGQQAYNAYLQQLNDIVPDLYAQERSQYDADRARDMQLYQLARDDEQTAYSRYQDDYNRWWAMFQNAQARENAARSGGGGVRYVTRADDDDDDDDDPLSNDETQARIGNTVGWLEPMIQRNLPNLGRDATMEWLNMILRETGMSAAEQQATMQMLRENKIINW